MPGLHARDERGVAFPSPLVMLSIVAVAMAGLAFLVTSGDGSDDQARVVTSTPSSSPSAEPTREAQPSPTKKPKPSPEPVERGDVFVEVYNNSGITGLAAGFSETATAAGWQVVGSDNWVGTIPSSTVYFPPRLEREAETLARDLGISRLMPAVEPMRFDRLTVILTGDVS